MAPRRHPLRNRIITRIRRGDFASVNEIMLVGTLPRQTVNRWLREEKIDLAAMRLRHLAKLHRQEEEYLDTRSGNPRPTQRQRWLETQRAVRKFNEAQAEQKQS
jgi:hypothetical protein